MTRLRMDAIRRASSVIAPEFLHSPQYECEPLGAALNARVVLKVETMNPIRCFKGRASEVVMNRLATEHGGSAVCASAGNLGQAMAYSGRSRGLKVIVVASAHASRSKLERIRNLGAEVRLVEGDIEAARHVARQISQAEGCYLIEDSENLDTCEGAATIGLEMAQSGMEADVILVALGGGAMASGVGYIVKALKPNVEIISVQPAGAPAMTRSWHAREVVNSDSMDTIADGVAGRFPIPEVLSDLLETIDDAVLVEEKSIVAGMRLLYHEAGLIVEPSAALGVAAILENARRFSGRRVATIICGSNVAPQAFFSWVG